MLAMLLEVFVAVIVAIWVIVAVVRSKLVHLLGARAVARTRVTTTPHRH
jgi:hypothetical protein